MSFRQHNHNSALCSRRSEFRVAGERALGLTRNRAPLQKTVNKVFIVTAVGTVILQDLRHSARIENPQPVCMLHHDKLWENIVDAAVNMSIKL
jgi:hypothetical protein